MALGRRSRGGAQGRSVEALAGSCAGLGVRPGSDSPRGGGAVGDGGPFLLTGRCGAP